MISILGVVVITDPAALQLSAALEALLAERAPFTCMSVDDPRIDDLFNACGVSPTSPCIVVNGRVCGYREIGAMQDAERDQVFGRRVRAVA